MTLQTFDEVMKMLESRVNLETRSDFSLQGMEERLEELRQLLNYLDAPETRYRTVHVAGTKGKGSTCVLLESILVENHCRVGRFSSPHLYSVRERIAINGTPCSEEEFVEFMVPICNRINAWKPKLFEKLTYFELITLFAFEYFAQKQVDVAIFEVGMGGRLDATNVCRPDVTVITSISFDHIAQLGPTLTDIATEKAGIIKSGIPLVSAVRHPEAQKAIRKIARERYAPEFFLGEAFSIHRNNNYENIQKNFRFRTVPKKFPLDFDLTDLSLSLLGLHQIRNASLAIAAALLLRAKTSRITLDKSKIRNALRNAYLPIRIEVLCSSNTLPTLIVDGAHNRSSISALIKTVQKAFPNKRLVAIFGISLGKDVEGMLTDLMKHFERIVLTRYSSNPRSFPPQGLKTIAAAIPNASSKIKDEIFGSSDENTVFLLRKESVILNSASQSSYETYHRVSRSATVSEETDIQIEVIENCQEALRKIWAESTSNDVICVTGSMFLAAELRKFFFEQIVNSFASGF
jgi:dihydrofolate synthase/folylpolyglutamate synthase